MIDSIVFASHQPAATGLPENIQRPASPAIMAEAFSHYARFIVSHEPDYESGCFSLSYFSQS
jgi:hypothetical protein